jgi:putative ATP-binding cassette transporter
VTGFRTTLAIIWRLAIPYFRDSEDRVAGRILLATVIALELGAVAINVLINQWNARFYNALQEKAWDTFTRELLVFCVLAGSFVVLRVYQLYLNQWLQIRWRRFMTTRYLGEWLNDGTHYRMQLLGDSADNPDQRIAEDVKQFIDGGSSVGILPIGLGLLNAIVSLASFVVILWGLSDAAPLALFGWTIPGYLVWAALIYAIAGTLFTHLIGRPLTTLNFNQQRYEADFRFNLVRTRENSEQIALLHGDNAERGRLLDRFSAVVANWLRIMKRTKQLTFLTASYNQASVIFPFILVSPAYFAGRLQLGGLTQTASAFNSVQEALSFFINVYRYFAEWRAVIERLAGFEASIAQARAMGQAAPAIEVAATSGGQIALDKLDVALPNGKPQVAADGITFAPGEQVLVTGPSGSGKSTLFRAISGIWPFGTGKVSLPSDAKVMILPQRPYLPIGTLAAAVSYPAVAGTFPTERIAELLVAVGLPALAGRLDEDAHWDRMLSVGEQQRIAIARAILQAPDYLLLDEASAALDEASETAVYTLLHERLPNATIVSIGHRSTLAAFHKRRLTLARDGERYVVKEAALNPAT